MTETTRTWELGLSPARYWPDSTQLESDPLLCQHLGEARTALIAYGVRELLTNATRHGGAAPHAVATLSLTVEARELRLVVPGSEFDSVARAGKAEQSFLHRFRVLLAHDGIEWRWRFEDSANCFLFSFGKRAARKDDEDE